MWDNPIFLERLRSPHIHSQQAGNSREPVVNDVPVSVQRLENQACCTSLRPVQAQDSQGQFCN